MKKLERLQTIAKAFRKAANSTEYNCLVGSHNSFVYFNLDFIRKDVPEYSLRTLQRDIIDMYNLFNLDIRNSGARDGLYYLIKNTAGNNLLENGILTIKL